MLWLLPLQLVLFALSTVPVAHGDRGDEAVEAESNHDLRPQEGYVGLVSNHAPEASAGGSQEELHRLFVERVKLAHERLEAAHPHPGDAEKPATSASHDAEKPAASASHGTEKPAPLASHDTEIPASSASHDAASSGDSSRKLAEDTAKMEEATKAAEQAKKAAEAAIKDWKKSEANADRAFEGVQHMAEATRKRTTAYFAAREVSNEHPLQEILGDHDVQDRRKTVHAYQQHVQHIFTHYSKEAAVQHGT